MLMIPNLSRKTFTSEWRTLNIQCVNSSVRPIPVSKWELKAKLGLKNAEDMTITCRAKTILLVALEKRAKAWAQKGQIRFR